MWLSFFVVAPQLHVTYELRIRFVEQQAWDCMIYVKGQLQSSFSGDGDTTANDLWSLVFEAIDAKGMVPTGD